MINKKAQLEYGFYFMCFVMLIIVIGFLMWVLPQYNVWSSSQAGKAELAQADYNRQIAVVEAEAKQMSAEKLALAEVARAKGVAQANQIIGESLKNNEDYLRYLWIVDVAGANVDKTIVYIPTETNLPILEASRNVNLEATK